MFKKIIFLSIMSLIAGNNEIITFDLYFFRRIRGVCQDLGIHYDKKILRKYARSLYTTTFRWCIPLCFISSVLVILDIKIITYDFKRKTQCEKILEEYPKICNELLGKKKIYENAVEEYINNVSEKDLESKQEYYLNDKIINLNEIMNNGKRKDVYDVQRKMIDNGNVIVQDVRVHDFRIKTKEVLVEKIFEEEACHFAFFPVPSLEAEITESSFPVLSMEERIKNCGAITECPRCPRYARIDVATNDIYCPYGLEDNEKKTRKIDPNKFNKCKISNIRRKFQKENSNNEKEKDNLEESIKKEISEFISPTLQHYMFFPQVILVYVLTYNMLFTKYFIENIMLEGSASASIMLGCSKSIFFSLQDINNARRFIIFCELIMFLEELVCLGKNIYDIRHIDQLVNCFIEKNKIDFLLEGNIDKMQTNIIYWVGKMIFLYLICVMSSSLYHTMKLVIMMQDIERDIRNKNLTKKDLRENITNTLNAYDLVL